jgi:phosphoglycolate phosphatase-like HAD superfamily hydrolase
MLIVFDVDGTLIDGEHHDSGAFDAALSAELGFVHPPGFFTALGDVTAETVVAAVAKHCRRELDDAVRTRIRERYLAGLKMVHAADPSAFNARSGARELLGHLRSLPGASIAIATGDWHSTISFKLQCAGFDLSGIPMATASDAVVRAEIIRLAVTRAGGELSRAIYVGDGRWDLHACRVLGIPLIATGRRARALVADGADHLCEVLSVASFLPVLRSAVGPRPVAL